MANPWATQQNTHKQRNRPALSVCIDVLYPPSHLSQNPFLPSCLRVKANAFASRVMETDSFPFCFFPSSSFHRAPLQKHTPVSFPLAAVLLHVQRRLDRVGQLGDLALEAVVVMGGGGKVSYAIRAHERLAPTHVGHA